MEKIKGEALHGFFFESLRRTDSYIASADQKASFTLAGGLAFLAIYASLFDKVISFPDTTLSKMSMLSLIGISIIPWIVWFYKIMKVFNPNVTPGKEISYVSFATLCVQNKTKDDFLERLSGDLYELDTEGLIRDVAENYWICSRICLDKMAAFRSSLNWLTISIAFTILVISLFSFLKSGIL
ncbi:hypothetical protein RYR54_001804 [Aeromonas sobria]|nr:hypothetical protein [Aeromonas sobria]